jgi:HAE1 family hydrophobic/amphiphilic exporter-1
VDISSICIRRPVLTWVIAIVITLTGGLFFSKLSIRENPDIDIPVVTITSNYLGSNAEYMENNITTPLEKQLINIRGLKTVKSTSATGLSRIMMEFEFDTNMEEAVNEIRDNVGRVKSGFPGDMEDPLIEKIDFDAFPTLWLALSSNKDNVMELSEQAKQLVKTPLERLSSVGEFEIHGARYYSMRIELLPEALVRHNLSPAEIEREIKAQNTDYPMGTMESERKVFELKLSSNLKSEEDFKNIIIKNSNGHLLRLEDIAEINLAPSEEESIIKFNGKKAVALGAIKNIDSNLISMSGEIRNNLAEIREDLPEWMNVEIAYDGAIPVKESIYAVFKTIMEAIILVIFVIMMFLASPAVTLIPAIAIPVSLIGAFALIYSFGFSINMFSLLAMILAIGIVVDDAIIMLENVFRYLEQGYSGKDAAIRGAGEIKFAIISTTLALIAVFLPVGFIEGFIGKLFIEFAWTLAFCVLVSGVVALTLTPMLASKVDSRKVSEENKLSKYVHHYLQIINSAYCRGLEWVFNNRAKFFLLNIIPVILLVLSFIMVKKEFIPQEDEGIFQVRMKGPEAMNLNSSVEVAGQAEEVLMGDEDVDGVFIITGFRGDSASAVSFVNLTPWAERDRSQSQIIESLNLKLDDIPGMRIYASAPKGFGGGGGGNNKPINFKLTSLKNFDYIERSVDKIAKEMHSSGYFENIETDLKRTKPKLNINIDKLKSYKLGIPIESAGKSMQYYFAGRTIDEFLRGNNVYSVVMQYPDKMRHDPRFLDLALIRDNRGKMHQLSEIANIEEDAGISERNHYNNFNSITLSANLKEDITLDKAKEFLDAKLDGATYKNQNLNYHYGGLIEQMSEANSAIIYIFGLALVFIYLVLSAQFESFRYPLLILFSVPFSSVGGILALNLTGDTLNLYSNIGLVTLIGLITKNAIMIIEFANQLLPKCTGVREAIFEASKLRLRPILMTTLATIFGAIPLILAEGAGAASRNSIGYVIIGGMSIGTLFTLFVIPALYLSFVKKHSDKKFA